MTIEGLRKTYGGVRALVDVDFNLARGEVHALCGENGAGKSTLVKIISGLTAPNSGRVVVDGIELRSGHKTDPRLVSIVYQELSIIPHLSVLDNALLGDKSVRGLYLRSRHATRVMQQLDEVGLAHLRPESSAGTLSVAERQLLEIARGILRGARILILDEPTASLSNTEIERVFRIVRHLRERGTAIIYISHRLPEIFALSDRVTVFRNGKRVLTEPTEKLTTYELVQAMIGGKLDDGQRRVSANRSGTPALQLRDYSVAGKFGPLDLDVYKGEIVGLTGQLGSGASAVVEALAGLEPGLSGKAVAEGEVVTARSLRDALRARIGYVPEDRGQKSLFLAAKVETNLTAAILDRVSPFGVIKTAFARRLAADLAGRFQINVARLPDAVQTLSGGNQQKVAIAKTVALTPRLLLLNEPTRGVDVGARKEIYRELRALADVGLTIVFFSTDLEEVVELASRVITIFRGRVVSDRPASAVTMDSVLSEVVSGGVATAAAA
jgi:ABC-type sugar transport system ATPase subunit